MEEVQINDVVEETQCSCLDKEELKKVISEEVTNLFERVLDYCEVAVSDNNQYRKLRAKILRIGNNCIRKLDKYVERDGKQIETEIEYK